LQWGEQYVQDKYLYSKQTLTHHGWVFSHFFFVSVILQFILAQATAQATAHGFEELKPEPQAVPAALAWPGTSLIAKHRDFVILTPGIALK
jgi:hypothetical protein